MPRDSSEARTGSAWEVFWTFLRLGCTSFGGPVAHLGYFREAFVVRRRWLEEATFAEIIGFCQSLPGPASSQVGFTIGLMRAGFAGAAAAWTGFTLPSACLMVAFALGHTFTRNRLAAGALHGLQLVAVAVVAQAVWGMFRTLAPDRIRASIAVLAAVTALLAVYGPAQILILAGGAIAGWAVLRDVVIPKDNQLSIRVSRGTAVAALALFALLLFGMPLLIAIYPHPLLAVFNGFYRSGALVFGGGHVVLPLLQQTTVDTGWVDPDRFLAGYGFAQALPGPLFTFAAYLGAVLKPVSQPLLGALVALVGIFLPGLLLVIGLIPFWNALRIHDWFRSALAGVNASVVGILLAALYRPVWTSTVLTAADFAAALTAFLLLAIWKLPPWVVVILSAGAGMAGA